MARGFSANLCLQKKKAKMYALYKIRTLQGEDKKKWHPEQKQDDIKNYFSNGNMEMREKRRKLNK